MFVFQPEMNEWCVLWQTKQIIHIQEESSNPVHTCPARYFTFYHWEFSKGMKCNFKLFSMHSCNNAFGQSCGSNCIKAYRHDQGVRLFFTPNNRTGKKCDIRDFDHGMGFGTRQGGLSIWETADLLGFHTEQSLGWEKTRTMCSEW